MKYNFFEWRDKIKKNPKLKLPSDINKPIKDWLKDIDCDLGYDIVEDGEENVSYEGVKLENDNVKDAEIMLQLQSGMIAERKEIHIKRRGPWKATIYKTIKNPNLDKRRLEK